MNTYGLDVLGRQRRRRHTPQFKATVVEQCQRPGVSIAAIALSYGQNANMVRKWVICRPKPGLQHWTPRHSKPQQPSYHCRCRWTGRCWRISAFRCNDPAPR